MPFSPLILPAIIALLLSIAPGAFAQRVSSAEALVAAVADGKPGAVIELAEGTFRLTQPLDLKSGVTLKGAGIGKTILTHAETWQANPATLPDPETNREKFDRTGYLIRCANDAKEITISHLTLTGPRLHGAIFGLANEGLHFHDLRIQDFMASGIRTYAMRKAKIHDCTFVNAGQRWERGQPGVKGGITGGGIFCIWVEDTQIWNNRFLNTKTAPNEHFYGIKGREGKRVRIHHNTIETNFSIEFPFENDQDVEIAHNVLHGTVSIPKHAGGPVPKSGSTFHIHHNHFRNSYSIEFVRNGAEIDHNLFDFDAASDGGNLISAFGNVPAPGPASFHHNLVSNPGRGVMWMNEPYGKLEVHNNHIIARTTKTPRTEGLFGFHEKSGFAEFRFTDNVIECQGTPRPLFRNDASAAATVENNRLVNVSDTARYNNAPAARPQGLEQPLKFQCGVNGEITVDGWKVDKTAPK
jgi:nitrous oxidase accessory protein